MLDFAHQDLPILLIIDDDMVSREVMATMLTMSGYLVHTAADGEAALGLLDSRAFVPGVILMDAQMPGLSGVPLIEQIRARSQALLYLVSASDPPDEIAAAADSFLLKPFAPEALTKMIEDHLAQSRPPKPPGLDPNETVVNPKTLARLREMMPDTGVRQIFEAIIADLGRRTTALEAAVARYDWAEARRIGHSIKGGASMAGAEQVARLGASVESGALEPRTGVNQVDNSSIILDDLRAAANNLQRILEAEIKA
jgi:DNA-binding response OmpR family regulator